MSLFGKPGGFPKDNKQMSADLPKAKTFVIHEPFSYCSAWDYRKVPDYTITNAERQFSTSVFPGIAILKKVQQIVQHNDNQAMVVEALYMTFVEMSRGFGWTWDPGIPAATPKLIDGKLAACECGSFAASFLSLAVTKRPFGLGLPCALFEYHPYYGEAVHGGQSGPGFVSFHPPFGCLDLLPNVHTPIGLALDEDLNGHAFYVWDNHKVVEYNGKFFDPTYGVQYDQKEDMVALKITDWEVLGQNGRLDILNFKKAAESDSVGKFLLETESQAHRMYYFRVTPLSLRGGQPMRWDGPLTVAQRNWLMGELKSQPTKLISFEEIILNA